MPLSRKDLAAIAISIVLAATVPAAAQQPPGEAAPQAEPIGAPAPEPASANDVLDEEAEEAEEEINLGGRVFVRNTITKAHVDGAELANELSVDSVRANIDLRKYGWLRVGIEVTFEEDGDIGLDDVFLRIGRGAGLSLEIGHFKRPMSPIRLASRWDLPVAERGIVNDNIDVPGFTVPLGLGGRSEGIMARYEIDTGIRPDFKIGLFNAELPRPDGGGDDPADLADNLLRDVYGRASIEPIDGLEIGGSASLVTRASDGSELESALIGSLDVTVSTDQFRVWLEGFAGQTTFFDGVDSSGTLLAFRLLAAPRFDDPFPHIGRLEPFAIVSVLDPTDESTDNRAIEYGGGISARFKKLLRLSIQYTYAAYDDNFPLETFSFLDTSTLYIELGSQFR
jgi:hypothetical protein